MQSNPSARRSAIESALVTGLSTAAVSGAAAVAGAILSRKFGHGVKAAGFFGAYGVYLVLVLVAGGLRSVALPRFSRAHDAGRLGREVSTWCVAIGLPLIPIVVVAIAWAGGIATALTGGGGEATAAAQLLPWLVPAAVAQVYAGIAASALAVFDDYRTAAAGFALGSIASLVVIVLLVDGHGIAAFGWGLAANGALALAVPLVPLLVRKAVGLPDRNALARLWELCEGAAVPVALQGLYLVAYRFAVGIGSTEATTLSYAYLISGFMVTITATSVAYISAVPLARGGLTPERTARHVVAASWLSLALVAAAAGVFALAGEKIVHLALGSHYSGSTGSDLGRLVVYLAPWMVASVALSVTFPLVFVRGRAGWMPVLAVLALLVHVPVEWAGRALFGVAGIAVGMAVTTGALAVVLLWALEALVATLRGLLVATLACCGLAAIAFAAPRALVGAVPAAAIGAALYCAALLTWRPAGLRNAWTYVRALR